MHLRQNKPIDLVRQVRQRAVDHGRFATRMSFHAYTGKSVRETSQGRLSPRRAGSATTPWEADGPCRFRQARRLFPDPAWPQRGWTDLRLPEDRHRRRRLRDSAKPSTDAFGHAGRLIAVQAPRSTSSAPGRPNEHNLSTTPIDSCRPRRAFDLFRLDVRQLLHARPCPPAISGPTPAGDRVGPAVPGAQASTNAGADVLAPHRRRSRQED